MEKCALDLTSYEFALLRALAERAGQVLSRDRLMELAHGTTEEAFDRSIDVHIFSIAPESCISAVGRHR